MHAAFGVGARQAVMAYFQRRVPEVTASFSRLFAGEPPPPSPLDIGGVNI